MLFFRHSFFVGSNIESEKENPDFREKVDKEMELESTMGSSLDEAIKSMKNVLT